MSIKHYKHVWANYPEVKGSHKLILLALAEFANEETDECWPSIARLCEMTGLKDRHVQNLLRDLEADSYISIETNHGRKSTNVYKFTMIEKVHSSAPFMEEEKAEKVHSSTEKVHSSTEKVHSSAPDPIEPIRNNNNTSQSSQNDDSKNQDAVLEGKKKKPIKPDRNDGAALPEHQEWFGAVCWLVYGHKDFSLLSKEKRIAIGKTIKDILASDNKYNLDDLRRWYKDKWSTEWPGKQIGKTTIQPPTLEKIKTGIGWTRQAQQVGFESKVEQAGPTYKRMKQL